MIRLILSLVRSILGVFMKCFHSLLFRFFVILVIVELSGASVMAASATSDTVALQGRWIRTDGPYVLEFRQAQDGSLQALYFNPKPINVRKTESLEQNGTLQILVELQDVNYSGSTYVLVYDRPQEMLKGVYFLPATKQKYNVTFVRQLAE